jgi:hypothetical protein
MPSPFPGMDPYLEANYVWPGFHNRLADEISTELNRILPAPYYADIDIRPELGVVEEVGTRKWIVPDVTVLRQAGRPLEPGAKGVALLAEPRREVSPSVEVKVHLERINHAFVEVRDSTLGHKLITLIEILSPSNKERGPDRKAYARKQRQVLESDASLIELDLLRGGRRVLGQMTLEAAIKAMSPPPPYLILVNRAWRRDGDDVDYEIFPVSLREWLPCIPVPLKQNEAEVPLDLQFVFNRAYDRGPYRRGAVDYSLDPPSPVLSSEDGAWAAELTRPWREAGTGRK